MTVFVIIFLFCISIAVGVWTEYSRRSSELAEDNGSPLAWEQRTWRVSSTLVAATTTVAAGLLTASHLHLSKGLVCGLSMFLFWATSKFVGTLISRIEVKSLKCHQNRPTGQLSCYQKSHELLKRLFWRFGSARIRSLMVASKGIPSDGMTLYDHHLCESQADWKESSDPIGIALLSTVLTWDPSSFVQRTAFMTLVQTNEVQVRRRLVEHASYILSAGRKDDAIAAFSLLSAHGTDLVRELSTQLLGCLAGPRDQTSFGLMYAAALKGIGSPAARAALVDALGSIPRFAPTYLNEEIFSLVSGVSGTEVPTEHLIQLYANSGSSDIIREAVLARFRADGEQPFIQALEHPDAKIRRAAYDVLGKASTTLASKEERARRAIAVGAYDDLVALGGDAVDVMIREYNRRKGTRHLDTDFVKAMVKIADVRFTAIFVDHLTSESQDLRRVCLAALQGLKFSPDRKNEIVYVGALASEGMFADCVAFGDVAVPYLMRVAERDATQRKDAIRALLQIGRKSLSNPLSDAICRMPELFKECAEEDLEKLIWKTYHESGYSRICPLLKKLGSKKIVQVAQLSCRRGIEAVGLVVWMLHHAPARLHCSSLDYDWESEKRFQSELDQVGTNWETIVTWLTGILRGKSKHSINAGVISAIRALPDSILITGSYIYRTKHYDYDPEIANFEDKNIQLAYSLSCSGLKLMVGETA